MLYERVLAQATSHPDRMAAVAPDGRLTYAELSDAGQALATKLRNCGIGRGCLVAIYLPRSTSIVTSLIGVLGCGAAYTIIEQGRNASQDYASIRLFGADLAITTPAHREALIADGIDAIAPVDGDRLLGPSVTSSGHDPTSLSDVAYLVFTSGTTGMPKERRRSDQRQYPPLFGGFAGSASDRRTPGLCACEQSAAADLGNTSIFLPLWTGGTVHLIDAEVRRDPSQFFEYLRSEHVDASQDHTLALAGNGRCPTGRAHSQPEPSTLPDTWR